MNQPWVVTGNNHTDLSLKVDTELSAPDLKESHIVISLSPTGFSVIVADEGKQNILLSAHKHWQEMILVEPLLKEFEKCLGLIPFPLSDAASAQVLINYNKFSLVPEHLYEKEQGPKILSYTAKLTKGDHIYSDHWKGSEAILVYACPLAIMEWIQKRFPNASIAHAGTAMDKLMQIVPKSEQFAYLHIEPNTADFYLAKDGKLQWYNNFDFSTEEDLLYFILYSLEQNRILATELELHLSGHSLRGDKLQALLNRYIGTIKEMDLPLGFALSSDISIQELRENFNLIGLLWRELLAENFEVRLLRRPAPYQLDPPPTLLKRAYSTSSIIISILMRLRCLTSLREPVI